MFYLHCSKQLLDWVPSGVNEPAGKGDNILGNWYAKAIFSKPQVALFVNERTLLPVLMPLAPASNLVERFPQYLFKILLSQGVSEAFMQQELDHLDKVVYCKSTNRSIIGILNMFTYHLEGYQSMHYADDCYSLSMMMADTPCGPLYKSTITPGNALREFASSGQIH
ncbi:hypothetical protein [Polynucleobacter sp. AP-Kaivos-20-H2]|uniref:DUF6933 domain-containing protein n=1 Tax=Polynucleobacter sp. AP-Kaivos-20-H2 TaxID=2689104 RepID=UPI001C0CBCE5|nr:hypothetical protein [Polynucleobacter sp. AP-Kaivos-20-H2]MBU3604870.1 hypothetical protein [Polynucleobacter sp. AP-Kaivos-20-H2]